MEDRDKMAALNILKKATIGHIGNWHLDLRSVRLALGSTCARFDLRSVSVVEPSAWGDLSSILDGSNTDRVSLTELLPRQLKSINQESLA